MSMMMMNYRYRYRYLQHQHNHLSMLHSNKEDEAAQHSVYHNHHPYDYFHPYDHFHDHDHHHHHPYDDCHPPHTDGFLMQLGRWIRSGCCAVLWGLLSICTYHIIYTVFIVPSPNVVQTLYFDYTSTLPQQQLTNQQQDYMVIPTAIVDLWSHTPPNLQLLPPQQSQVTQLRPHQSYSIQIQLLLPNSPTNRYRTSMFTVQTELYSQIEMVPDTDTSSASAASAAISPPSLNPTAGDVDTENKTCTNNNKNYTNNQTKPEDGIANNATHTMQLQQLPQQDEQCVPQTDTCQCTDGAKMYGTTSTTNTMCCENHHLHENQTVPPQISKFVLLAESKRSYRFPYHSTWITILYQTLCIVPILWSYDGFDPSLSSSSLASESHWVSGTVFPHYVESPSMPLVSATTTTIITMFFVIKTQTVRPGFGCSQFRGCWKLTYNLILQLTLTTSRCLNTQNVRGVTTNTATSRRQNSTTTRVHAAPTVVDIME
jgi:Putative adipose-regulatory protein (Seipin)